MSSSRTNTISARNLTKIYRAYAHPPLTPSPLTGEGRGRSGEFAEHTPRPLSGSGVQAGARPAREGEMLVTQNSSK